MTNTLNDTEIVKRAQNGDEQAFEVLFKRYYRDSYRLAFRWFRNQADAEDVAQESFVRVAKSLKNFKFESSFKTWLFRIVMNCCKDLTTGQSRKRKLTQDFLEQQKIENQPSLTSNTHVAQAEIILNTLTPKAREVFILVVFEDMSHAEAAQVLKCSETTISWHIHWSKKKIKDLVSLRKAIL